MAEDFQFRFYHKIFGFFLTYFHYVRVGLLLLLYVVTHPFTPFSKYRPATPKCIIDSKHGHHKYVKVNGIKLHYVEKGDTDKPLMLFLHGFPEFWYSWRYQIQEFSKDYWCIAIDMRGFGDSEKPKGLKQYKMLNILNDIKELILVLGRERVTLVSHDWGSVIAMSFLDQYTSMVDKLVVMSGASLRHYNEVFWNEWWQFKHGWYILYFQGPFLPELTIKMNDFDIFSFMQKNKNTISEEDIEAFKYTFGKVGALTPPLNYYRANYATAYTKKPAQEVIPKGLFLLGEFDEYISKTIGDLLKKDYGFKTVIVKGAHHFIQQEVPEEVNKLIRDFLEE